MIEVSHLVVGLDSWVAPLAYVGPGAGLSMLGALLAVCVLLLFALLSPLLFVVRLVRGLYSRSASQLNADGHTSVSPKG